VPPTQVSGVIDDVGSGVTGWKKASRVGVGCTVADGSASVPPRDSPMPQPENLRISSMALSGIHDRSRGSARASRRVSTPWKPVRLARALPPSTLCATAAHCLQTSFRPRHWRPRSSRNSVCQQFGYKVAAVGRGSQKACSRQELGGTCTLTARPPIREEPPETRWCRVILATATDQNRCPTWSRVSLERTLLVVPQDRAR